MAPLIGHTLRLDSVVLIQNLAQKIGPWCLNILLQLLKVDVMLSFVEIVEHVRF